MVTMVEMNYNSVFYAQQITTDNALLMILLSVLPYASLTDVQMSFSIA